MFTFVRAHRPRFKTQASQTSPRQAAADPVERTLRLSVVEGSITQIFLNWTSGSVLIGYMLFLGASPTQIGLISSVPLLAQVMSPLAAWLAALAGRRKGLTIAASLLGRGLWLLAAFLPALGVPAALQPTFMVALIMVSSLFQASAGTLWAAHMGDVVPDTRRGRYFGLRTGIVGVVGMSASLGAGWFLDHVAAPVNFQMVIFVSVLCALLGIVLYGFHYEPPAAPQRVSLRDVVAGPLREPNFRRFLLFSVYWQGAVLLAAPFVFPYFIGELKMNFTHIAIWSAVASTCALITTAQWGRVADRFGNKVVLAIGTVLAGAALPLCWVLAGLTGRLEFVWASAVFDALAWGAIGPAIFNLALASAPRNERAAFIAVYSLATGLAGFAGGLLSGPLLTLFLSLNFQPFGVSWTGYHTLFVLSGFLRVQAWRFLRPVQETNAWRTRDVLRELRSPWRKIGFPWR